MKKKKKQKKHKHQWRKVEATYNKESGLVTTKKRCISCKDVKKVETRAHKKSESRPLLEGK